MATKTHLLLPNVLIVVEICERRSVRPFEHRIWREAKIDIVDAVCFVVKHCAHLNATNAADDFGPKELVERRRALFPSADFVLTLDVGRVQNVEHVVVWHHLHSGFEICPKKFITNGRNNPTDSFGGRVCKLKIENNSKIKKIKTERLDQMHLCDS